MIYLLVIHCDDRPGVVVKTYPTKEARIEATKLEIYNSEMDDQDKDMWAKQLADLEEDMRLDFEGDPPIEWLDAIQLTVYPGKK